MGITTDPATTYREALAGAGLPAATGDLAAESRRVVRHFQRYNAEHRADRAASHRLGHQQRHAVGECYYTHPDVPGVAFDTRRRAAVAGLAAQAAPEAPADPFVSGWAAVPAPSQS